jgi:hypothetical protein
MPNRVHAWFVPVEAQLPESDPAGGVYAFRDSNRG